MISMALFFLGAACGAFLTALAAHKAMNAYRRWCAGKLDYWANRCSEMQEQLNAMEKKQDEGEGWKHDQS